MKKNFLFGLLICAVLFSACKEEESTKPESDQNQSDSQLIVDKYVLPAGETAEFQQDFEIIAEEGMEINGTILCDGNLKLTATNGDIIIGGKISFKDSSNFISSTGKQTFKNTSEIKSAKASDGFSRTVNAANGNIILKKGATIFSGRGQHASTVTLNSISGYYEGEAGGNGGLIILNAPNGTVELPELGDSVTPFMDEVFVLGNGGDGANVVLDESLDISNLEVLEVRGGEGGNSGELIIEALEIQSIPSLEAMETHPDFIYGGEGGFGGYVFWSNAGNNRFYAIREIVLHGGNGGNGAKYGGNGGFAYFSPSAFPIGDINDPVPNVFCYGGDGGDVFPSPLPLTHVRGGNGGEYCAKGVTGPDGGYDFNDNILFRDGANGGNAFGQGGNGGDIQEGVRSYEAVGGSGGHSDEAQTELLNVLGNETVYLSSKYGVVAGDGGNGYSDCEGCPGGDGGNAGTATAVGGNGGNVLGEAVKSFGGDGGDTWAVLAGNRGEGGNGNPPGKAGDQPQDAINFQVGKTGNGAASGKVGVALGLILDPLPDQIIDGELCGETLTCENDSSGGNEYIDNCPEGYATFELKTTSVYESSNNYIVETETWFASVQYPVLDTTETFIILRGYIFASGYYSYLQTNNGEFVRDTVIQLSEFPDALNGIMSPQCSELGQIMWADDGVIILTQDSNPIETQMTISGCNIAYTSTKDDYRCCYNPQNDVYFPSPFECND